MAYRDDLRRQGPVKFSLRRSARFADTPISTRQVGRICAQKNHRNRLVLVVLAAGLGFEPRQTESESAVLPLHNPATCISYYNQFFANVNPFSNFNYSFFKSHLKSCNQSSIMILTISPYLCAGVSEWQTRRTQNPLAATSCGFKSHRRHHKEWSKKMHRA